MKGIMVPLLVVWMTGIVIGQQPEAFNQFGSSSFSAPPQNNLPGQDQFSLPPVQPMGVAESQLAPFELDVSQKDIMGIKYDEGFLQSRIEPIDPKTGKPLPRSVVNGISLVFSGLNSSTLPSVNFSSEPKNHVVQGKNILAFGITDADINNLQTRKLDYRFKFTERGKYDEVVIFYAPPTSPKTNFGPTPDDSVNSNPAFGSRNNGAFNTPLIPLPAPEHLPGDANFMGPVLPSGIQPPMAGGSGTQIARRDNSGTNWAPPNARTLTNPVLPPILGDQGNPQPPDQWTLPTRQFGQPMANTADRSQPATRQPTFDEQVAYRKAQIEQEKMVQDMGQRKAILDAYEQELIQKAANVERQQQEFAQQKYRDSLRTSKPFDIAPDYSKPTAPMFGTPIGTRPVVDRPDRMASLNPGMYPAGSGDEVNSNRPNNQTMPQPSNGGIKDYTASISGTNKDNQQTVSKQDKRVEGFVMFMLFCSLGLNIYLGWISRGFYVRYNELADELRETFTATM